MSDEEVEVVDTDCSRSRLNSLKSVAKYLLLLSDTQVNDEFVKKEITGITEKERASPPPKTYLSTHQCLLL